MWKPPADLGSRLILEEPFSRDLHSTLLMAKEVDSDVPVVLRVMSPERSADPKWRRIWGYLLENAKSVAGGDVIRIREHSPVEELNRPDCQATLWYSMDCAEGSIVSLSDWSGLRWALDSVLGALSGIHSRDHVHGNIKPENVLYFFGESPAVRLSEVGLGYREALALGAAERSLIRADHPSWYAAPEAAAAEWRRWGFGTDLYQVGCLAWDWCSSGSVAVATEEVSHSPTDPIEPRFEVPDGFAEWVAWLVQSRSEDRPGSAAEARDALARLSQGDASESLQCVTARGDSQRQWDTPWSAVEHRPRPGFVSAIVDETAEESPRDSGTHRLAFEPHATPFQFRSAAAQESVQSAERVWKNGRAEALFLCGPDGVGKTTLSEEVISELRGRGAVVLSATHNAHDGSTDGLYQMLETHFRCHRMALDATRECVQDVLDVRGNAASASGLSRVICESRTSLTVASRVAFADAIDRYMVIYHYCRLRAEKELVVVCLDDVHLSVDSLSFLHYCLQAQKRSPAPIFFVASATNAAGLVTSSSQWLERVLKCENARTLELEFPRPSEHGEWVESTGSYTDELREVLTKASQGKPSLVDELMSYWKGKQVVTLAPEGQWKLAVSTDALSDHPADVWRLRWQLFLRASGASVEIEKCVELAAMLGLRVSTIEWLLTCGELGATPAPGLLERLVAAGFVERHYAGFRFLRRELVDVILQSSRLAKRWTAGHLACLNMLTAVRRVEHLGVARRRAFHAQNAFRVEEPAALVARLDYVQHVLMLQGRNPECEDILVDVIAKAQMVERPDLMARALELSGRIFVSLGYFEDAIQALELGRNAYAQSDDLTGESNVLRILATIARTQGAFADSLSMYEEALEMDRSRGDRRMEALTLGNIAQVHQSMGNLSEAERVTRAALGIVEALQEKRIHGNMLANLASLEQEQGCSAAAKKTYEKALVMVRTNNDHESEATVLGNLAELYRAEGEYENARTHFAASMKISRDVDDRIGVAITLGNLAHLEADLGNFDAAIELYEEDAKICEEEGDDLGKTIALGNLAMARRDSGGQEAALETLREASVIGASLQNPVVEAWLLSERGKTYRYIAMITDARACQETADQVLRHFPAHAQRLVAACELGHLALEQGLGAESFLSEAKRLAGMLAVRIDSDAGRCVATLERAIAAMYLGETLVVGECPDDFPEAVRRRLIPGY
jgi:eukaryotic-like serine/threonine-protein kinase